jgi:DNA polymerase I-like protein with 3'-5' exonuclease and polymerase domains
MELACDTETTGLDLMHGCRPFYVSFYKPESEQDPYGFRLSVDPKKRLPKLTEKTRNAIRRNLLEASSLIFHNAKFDLRGLELLGVISPKETLNLLDKCEDTCVAFHALASGESHKLKDLALKYLNIPDDDQDALQEACTEARRIAKKLGWRIAGPNDPHWPAMKSPPKGKQGGDSWWAADMWLPRELVLLNLAPKGKEDLWLNVCETYGLRDAYRTGELWQVAKEGLTEENLWDQYQVRKRNLRAFYGMESRGISYSLPALQTAKKTYLEEAKHAEATCFALADYKIDNLASDKQLKGILFGKFGVTPVKETKTGYSADKTSLDAMIEHTPKTSPGYHFMRNLIINRQRNGACRFLETYQQGGVEVYPDFYRLYATANLTGTDTTRCSFYNPNPQQVSKQEKYNLREIFGPIPGRVWYTYDYDNIEMRIFAYAAQDQRLIAAFEHNLSVHNIIAEELYPNIFQDFRKLVAGSSEFRRRVKTLPKELQDIELQREVGELFKKKYKSTLYQWVKNGNFALLYGAGQYKADTTYHKMGSYKLIRRQFPEIDRLLDEKYQEAKEYGYITTIGGYRLEVPHDGPHKAVNYFCQGSAGYLINCAIANIDDYLRKFPDHFLMLQVHDELDFDFPEHYNNLPLLRKIKYLMEEPSKQYGLPLTVSCNRISQNWAKEEFVAL